MSIYRIEERASAAVEVVMTATRQYEAAAARIGVLLRRASARAADAAHECRKVLLRGASEGAVHADDAEQAISIHVEAIESQLTECRKHVSRLNALRAEIREAVSEFEALMEKGQSLWSVQIEELCAADWKRPSLLDYLRHLRSARRSVERQAAHDVSVLLSVASYDDLKACHDKWHVRLQSPLLRAEDSAWLGMVEALRLEMEAARPF
mmetsp:Transcript_12269/g.33092  ORF Transcript_12269/g.33092 Transcript_12269/m.33092 type:complete len:209 (-) Transcript_12269:967-1593(-)